VNRPAIRHPGELRWETRLISVVTLVLVALGVAVCYAAGTYREDWYREASQQVSGALVGGVLFLIASRLDYRLWRSWSRPLFIGTAACLGMIAVAAVIWPSVKAPSVVSEFFPFLNGARRWIRLGGMQIQVSEIARFTMPVLVAAIAADLGKRITDFRQGFVRLMMPVAVVVVLTALQPNLSMAILLGMMGVLVAFVAGVRFIHITALALPAIAGAAIMIYGSEERMARLDAFMTPSLECVDGDQVCESMIGLGNGGVLGVGFGEGTQKLGHLAYGYSDFILSVVGEEWGFIGVGFMSICFILFCWVGFRIARTAPDMFGMTLAGGLTAMVGVAAFMHAAVVSDLMPATGLPLPFISAGRVSLVIYMLAAGVIVSIGKRRGRPAGAK
jgi:cell division protein FtsW